jgi:pyruvate dehydrogenase E2 component (dihydrolipoyllysine-residue acetyltransferase)
MGTDSTAAVRFIIRQEPGASGSNIPGEGSMATDVVMPQMGESITEGTIAKWLKRPGERVEKDEPLLEISTDKVDAEIASPVAGVLAEIKFAEGDTVDVNTVIAIISDAADSVTATDSNGTQAAQASAAAAQSPAAAATVPAPGGPSVTAAPIADGRRIRSSPLVRRIAREKDVDLALVPGTGSAGRITKDDILGYLSKGGAGASAAAVQRPAAQRSGPLEVPGDLVPMTRMRAIIAERMVESKRISPHVYSVYKVDMTRVVRLRERTRDGFEQRHGVKLTFMPFIAAAAVEALRQFPIVNASLEGGSIRYHRSVHLGIAVALEWGLIVPVVREAHERRFAELARTIADLAARARAKKLLPDESSGSTFTLTNSGLFGDEFGTPIINQPESAILAIGALRKEPVVLTDAEGNDSIAIRSMQHFCLGFDHRLIDGADAGRFMSAFKKALESWDRETG